ncbi:class I SAM-dependent methyltransferase [Halobium salinum]|uniref:Class I SAM-dependent methyltransferase n=1 Tax=Halobium salinum TaxID=1364940 RepID=A0ABD5PGN3_9EURY|nr:class I SAM-dependent methyltransferase [Halobium salinum]
MERFENTRQPDWDWWGRLWPTPGATLRRLGVAPEETLAEVGSGNGYFALPVARIADPAMVYAVDLDERLLDELAHLASAQGIDTVEPVRGDARELSDLLPEPVDRVLFANALHGVDDPGTLLRQCFESLRPGGQFVVVNWHARPREETAVLGEPRGPPPERRMTPEATERVVLDAADFDLVEDVDLPPHHYGLVFER